MYKRNDGLTGDHRLQNQFTAYVQRAVHNGCVDYLFKKIQPLKVEVPLEDMDDLVSEDTDFVLRLADYEDLRLVLQKIQERERYILLARVVEEKSFLQIAQETGMRYKAVAAVYYRTLDKLRKLLGGGRNEF